MPFLALLTSPVAKYVGIALAVLAFIAYQRHDAASDARMKAEVQCRAEVEERTAAELDRQRTVAETVLQKARDRQAITEKELAELRSEADVLLSEMGDSRDSCRLSGELLNKLRAIR